MIRPDDLREEVIRPALRALAEYDQRMNTEAAVELLMGTAARESLLGYYLTQIGDHPSEGLGIFSMELSTSDSLWEHYLAFRPELASIVRDLATKNAFDSPENRRQELISNHLYAAAMVRIKYWKVPEAMPENLRDRAYYWKKYYNTHLGKGTVDGFIMAYKKYVEGIL